MRQEQKAQKKAKETPEEVEASLFLSDPGSEKRITLKFRTNQERTSNKPDGYKYRTP